MTTHNSDTFDSELIIGLVGAVGASLKSVIELLEEQLHLARYETRVIKVSEEIIRSLVDVPEHQGNPYKRTSELMTAGNSIREKTNDNGVLALGVAAQIYAERQEDPSGYAQPFGKTAFIVDSLKRPEEVEVLRQMYPSGFVLVSAYEAEPDRRKHLSKQKGMSDDDARELINRDAEEAEVPHGQRLNSTFHLADFFLHITDRRERLAADIRRMVELWFGNPFITPTFDEFAMFMAFAAGLRSADLSRQVGAVVARDRQILSTGANDCPRAGGGLYWPEREAESGEIKDIVRGRDHTRDEDSNRAEQLKIINQIASRGEAKGDGLDAEKLRRLLEKSRIGDLTEFGRVVHAEMEALLACGRAGISTRYAALYCTTFPCHNCAKHIIAAGICQVVYVEPYPKSKALEFHDDAITIKGGDPHAKARAVRFQPFVGIGPRRFFDLFSMRLTSGYELHRKDGATGKKRDWDIKNSRLRIHMPPFSYLDLELQAASRFHDLEQAHYPVEESEDEQ